MPERGFIKYNVKENDTVYRIAMQFNTSINRILMANPKTNIYNLNIGEELIIPTGNIISTNTEYNSKMLFEDIASLKILYPFLEVGEIGKSVLGKPLYYIKIGKGQRSVFYNGSFHANEWITTPILMKFAEEYLKSIVDGKNIYGYDAKLLYNYTSLYIVPMVNPDGVDLVTGSLENVDNIYEKVDKIANDFPEIPFPSGWKANINGVDLKNFQPIYLEYDVVKFSMFLGIPTILQEISIKIFSQFSSKIFQIFLTKSPFTFETFQILTTFIF